MPDIMVRRADFYDAEFFLAKSIGNRALHRLTLLKVHVKSSYAIESHVLKKMRHCCEGRQHASNLVRVTMGMSEAHKAFQFFGAKFTPTHIIGQLTELFDDLKLFSHLVEWNDIIKQRRTVAAVKK